jgi:outer membrane protein
MKRISFLLLIVCSFASSVYSQDSLPTTIRWDLPTAIAYAREHNLQVTNTRLNEGLSEQDLLLARAARYPNLSGNATQTYTNSKNTNPVVGGFQTQSNLSGNYGLSSSWTIYRGGYINKDVESKSLQLQSANLNTRIAENDITLQITQAYLNVLLAKESIVYVDEQVKTSRAQYD